MSKLSAAQLEAQYGDELRQLHAGTLSARRMHNALLQWQPPLDVSDGVLKVWIQKYSTSTGTPSVLPSAGTAQVSAASAGSVVSTGAGQQGGQSAAAPTDTS